MLFFSLAGSRGSDFYDSTICQESKDIEVSPQWLHNILSLQDFQRDGEVFADQGKIV